MDSLRQHVDQSVDRLASMIRDTVSLHVAPSSSPHPLFSTTSLTATQLPEQSVNHNNGVIMRQDSHHRTPLHLHSSLAIRCHIQLILTEGRQDLHLVVLIVESLGTLGSTVHTNDASTLADGVTIQHPLPLVECQKDAVHHQFISGHGSETDFTDAYLTVDAI